MRLRTTILKNALSNLLRGGATAVVSLALPHFLIQSLDVSRFSAWSLMLQVAAYSSFLDFGLGTAVGRFVAKLTELNEMEQRKKLIQTSLCLFLLAAGLAMIVIATVTSFARHIFSGLPSALVGEFRIAGIVLGCGAALQLIFAPFTGVLIGLHRNEVPAFVTVISRLGGALLVIVASRHSHSLVLLACIITTANFGAGAIQAFIVLKLLPELRAMKLSIDRVTARELLRFCLGLGSLTVATFLVQGLDVTIVGRFSFNAVGYYTIATSVISVLVGADNAVMSAFLAPLSAMHARGEHLRIAKSVLNATWATSFLDLLILIIALFQGQILLSRWVGPVYAASAAPILVTLLSAQMIRLVTAPLTTSLIACNLHMNAVVGAFTEAFVNLSLSLYLIKSLGPMGVAYGTLGGACVSLAVHVSYTLPRTQELAINAGRLLKSGVLLPFVALLPLILLLFVRSQGDMWTSPAVISAVVGTTLLCSLWSWHLQRHQPHTDASA